LQALRPTSPLSLRLGFAAPWLTLWDEGTKRLVSFRDARPLAPLDVSGAGV
jgi:hypothetical protein